MPPDFHYGFVQKAELVLDLEETGCESVKRRKEGVEDAVWDHPARDIHPPHLWACDLLLLYLSFLLTVIIP